ncbi:peptidoglycan-binding protein, partial [Bacillus sp. JJ722]
MAGLGEVSIFGERGLKEFSFNTFFPKTYNPTYCAYTDFPTPDECIETIERWRDTRRPIRFIVTGTKVNYAVTIREFEYDLERAGHAGDVYFSLALKEYRFLTVREETVGNNKNKKPKKNPRPPVV